MNKYYVSIKPNEEMVVHEKDLSTVDTYNLLRSHVEGYIECFRLNEDIDIWLNEEGKLIGLEPSMAIVKNGEIVELLMGNLLVAGHNVEGDTISLTKDQLTTFTNYLGTDAIVKVTFPTGEERAIPFINLD